MTKAEYARHRGITSASVAKLVSNGSIFTDSDGMIDQEIADILLENNSPQSKRRTKPKPKPKPKPSTEIDRVVDDTKSAILDNLSSTGSYVVQRAKLTAAKASMAEIELARLKAESVKSADVYSEAFECGRMLRDAGFGISDRLASILAAETSESSIRKLLDAELRKVFDIACDNIIRKYELPGGRH